MSYIQNHSQLATSKQRQVALDLIEAAYQAIQPDFAVKQNISKQDSILKLGQQSFDLSQFNNVYLVGFGKGSANISLLIEQELGDSLTEGWVVDVTEVTFSKIKFTLGNHPLPSQANLDFTHTVVEALGNLTDKDLVIVVTCGGGSAMFEAPQSLDLDGIIAVNKALLKAGATISEMNTVRKHISKVKGGGLAHVVHPATVANLLFSDVPGNDLNVIASGPTVKDPTTIQDALALLERFKLGENSPLTPDSFTETPKDDQYFANIHNILVLSNDTALQAMQAKATELGLTATIHSNHFQGEASQVAKQLLDITQPGQITLAGGETTVTVSSDANGTGGRNQEVVLGSLQHIQPDQVVISFASDGWDNTPAAGAIGDTNTIAKAQTKNVDIQDHLNRHDSLAFFTETGDTIQTGRLPSNVADLFIVIKGEK